MKSKLLISLLILSASFIACSEKKSKENLSENDYKNAAAHMSRDMNSLIYNQIDERKWINEHTLLYRKSIKGGNEYIIADLNTKEKKSAFDQTKLAASLGKFLNEELDASNLPLRGLDLNLEANSLSFSTKGKEYKANLSDYSLTEKAKPKFSTSRTEIASPNGELAAYISQNNLWVRDLISGATQQLTFDGKQDYGYGTDNAGWKKSDRPVLTWSPNSDKIATFQQDSRGVKEMYLTSSNVGHPRLEAWKHPLPGDSIVFKIERVIIHVNANPKVVRLKIPADYQRSTITDHVAGRNGEFLDLDWKNDGSKLAFVSSSRDHKIAHLQVANTSTGEVESVLKEETATYFESGVNKINWHVLFESNEVLWFSERDNWGHMYLYDLQGNLKNQITKGDWAVQQLLNVDESNRNIIFTAGGKEEGNPYHKYLYKINFNGENLINLTPEKGDHNVSPSPNWTSFEDSYSTTENPPISVIKNTQAELLMELEKADITALKEADWQQPIEFSVKARDNETDLYGILYLPSHYDENKSYPVVNYIYPGPQSGSVGSYNFRATRRDNQAIAELGFVVVAVDAMGTPKRSKSFHDFYYGNMGDNGIPDNITAIKQLAQQYKGMDIERVGIWGHSGGGFASTGALFRYPEFYDVAVSGAGNHDNRNYEADWGEKWHGLLKEGGKIENKADGTTNYDSQANQLLAENLQGKLLITHGSMDNNVPPSNTMLVVEELIRANKDFDMILFPNQRHGYGDMTSYMTRKRWDYFVKHLLGVEPPKEFGLDNL